MYLRQSLPFLTFWKDTYPHALVSEYRVGHSSQGRQVVYIGAYWAQPGFGDLAKQVDIVGDEDEYSRKRGHKSAAENDGGRLITWKKWMRRDGWGPPEEAEGKA